MTKQNKVLICIDCRKPFEFTTGEQRFFSSKGLSQPKRCPACREKRRLTINREVAL